MCKWPGRADAELKTFGRSSRIQHVPLIAENPAQRRKLAVNHPPLEIVPRAQILQAVLPFDLRGGLESAFPNIALYGPARMVFDRECLFLDDLGLAKFDFLARDLVPVVPNLMEQQVYRVYDLLAQSA